MTEALAMPAPCTGCRGDVAPALLACPGCGRLVHGAALTEHVRSAERAEAEGDLTSALTHYREACTLLPARTVQRATLEQRMSRLSANIDGRAEATREGVLLCTQTVVAAS